MVSQLELSNPHGLSCSRQVNISGLTFIRNGVERIFPLVPSSRPFQHRDWAVTPAADRVMSKIDAEAVLAVCCQAFVESGPRSAI